MGENQDIFNRVPKNSVVLNAVNISKNSFEEHSSIIENRNNWHAFLIHNVKRTERNVILKIVLDHVYPEALLPIRFQSRGTDCIFLARNCSGAIGKLLKNKLVIPDPSEKKWNYTCEVILMYSTISKLPLPANNIAKILELLFEEKSKILNLTNFSENKDLLEYSPLSQPKLLCFALHLSDELKPKHIKLNDNEIRTLSPFQILKGKSSIEILDLRNNLIGDLEELNYLNHFNLVEIWLDGNPVCEKYDPFTYAKNIKKILPTLEKLDGVSIGTQELPISQQFFLCNNEGFDLADQFVSHFFSLYDNERKLLVDLYHPSAIFSMTTYNSKRSEANERLQVYRDFSRNIINSKSSWNSVAVGNTKILNVLCQLPETKHYIHAFTVDMIHYTESSAVISISGAFVENSKAEFVFDFKRTFTVIKRFFDHVICNDILYISNGSNCEVEVTQKLRENEKKMTLAAMSQVTGVHKVWVERLLEDADYKINKFLMSFMSLLKSNKIPQLAYSRNNEQSLMEWLVPKMKQYGLEKFECSLQKEAREYIEKTKSLQTISTIPTISSQKYGCLNTPQNGMAIGAPFNADYSNCTPKLPKNSYKNNLIQIKNTDFFEIVTNPKIENKDRVMDITSPETSQCKETNRSPISNPQGNKRKGPVLELDGKKKMKEEGEILQENDNICTHANSGELDPKKSEKKKNVPEERDEDGSVIEKTPTWVLLNNEWLNVREHNEYDFHLALNKWILVQKDKEGKFSPVQDDFQKNFTCWKKHFPTYSNENLVHSLHSSCLNAKLKSAFSTIKHPVTFWDFPATVPYDIRPPKRARVSQRRFKVLDSGYGFVSVKNKWVLVAKNGLDSLVTPDNQKKVIWKGNGWDFEELTSQEKALMGKMEVTASGEEKIVNLKATEEISTDPNKSENTISAPNTIDRKEMTKSDNIQDTFFVCEDEDVEIAPEDLDIDKKELEELKAIYTEDTETEKTITSNSELRLLQSGNKENNLTQQQKAEVIGKWKKLFEFVPYVPKLALLEGYWTLVCEKCDMKFHKTLNDNWILLEKNSETKEWCEVKDDFCMDNDASMQSKSLGKFVFDHIPMPVTMHDFPSSVPVEIRPPHKIIINGKEVLNVTPDSGYAYVSVRGQWIAVKKDAKLEWVAVDPKNQTVVKKKLANMPKSKPVPPKEATVEVEKETSATCNLFQLLTGVKLEKPLTYWDMEGSEEKRPPKLALTEVNGEQRWCHVGKNCGKGFVLHDGVWVKVVSAGFGKWKATQYSAYPGCIIGYYLFNDIWVTLKKFILGGKWSPIFDPETYPTTYWNHIGPEETKPPKKIGFGKNEKVIHNNSNMGFIYRENAWVLMEKQGAVWKTVKNNENYLIYKLINGMWRIIEKDAEDKWSYKPLQQEIFTYDNFDGIKKYAPPKQLSLFSEGRKNKKIIDEKSGLGFILKNGVWVLKKLKDGQLIPVKDSKGKANFGYKLIDGKFEIIRMDEKGQWMQPNVKQNKKKQTESAPFDRLFKNATPLTYDRVLIDVPESLKPPKHALMKVFGKSKEIWRVIDQNSGYGFIRDNDTWLLMRWICDENWVDESDEIGHRYKVIDNRWTPVKNENNLWVPIFDPKTTPKVPELCVESPEKDLPDKILIDSGHVKSKINVVASGTMGYLKISDGYALVNKLSNGKLCLVKSSDNAVIFKLNKDGKWLFSTPPMSSLKLSDTVSDRIENLKEIKTYDNTEGPKPPQYVKMMEEGSLKWKEVDSESGYGFVRRKYWRLVKKTGENWIILNTNEGYDIVDNRWVLMKKNADNQWLPDFDPYLTPRCSLDSVGEAVFPIRVITYKNGQAKYINIAKDCSLAFTVCAPNVCALMKQQGSEWTAMQDDFEEAPIMTFKLIDCKWRRVKKDTKTNQWLPSGVQFDLPVLHIDIVGDKSLQPPSHIRIVTQEDKEYNLRFNIFSEEGFVKEDGCWVLLAPTENGWTKHPGVFGSCGYKFVDGKLAVMSKVGEVWEEYGSSNPETPMEIPISHPVTYKEIQLWPEQEKPPMDILVFQHSDHVFLPDECTCNYGFVKHENVWVVVKKVRDKWELEKKGDECFAYKLIGNRWIPMKIVNGKHWGVKDDDQLSPHTPRTYIDTYGTFEQKPPLRITIGDNKWKLILDNDKFGFAQKDDMWVLMFKHGSHWKEYSPQGTKMGYKIVDGQWTRFTKSKSDKWVISKQPNSLLSLSCDFTPGHKNAPPSSLCFGYSPITSKFKYVALGPGSGKGFLKDNGAWVLMRQQKNDSVQIKRFNSIDNHGYMLRDEVWKIVIKDIDGSWKSGSFVKGKWSYDSKLSIAFNKPISKQEIEKLPSLERPPQSFIMFEYAIPKKVSLTSIENSHGFANNKGVWVLLSCLNSSSFKWETAGGVVAYKLIKNRWVSMTFQNSYQKWVPSYDPLHEPLTHFESTESSERPPLRIALNEGKTDKWKVIYQHSGYGFLKKDDVWILMEKGCDGTWRKHEDHFQEFTGYKMVNSKWTRFKKRKDGEWTRRDAWLPSLPCDFSETHDRLPPPSWNSIFLKDPRNIRYDTDVTLASYSKFGFREDGDVWVLMDCDDSGVWKQRKIFPNNADSYGYKFVSNGWRLMKKMKDGKWAQGKFEYTNAGGVVFVEDESNSSNQNKQAKNDKTTSAIEQKEVVVKAETKVENVTKKTEQTKTVTRERVPDKSNKEEIGNVNVTKKTEKTETVTRERTPDNSNKEEIGNVDVTKKTEQTKTERRERVPDNSNKEEIGSAIVKKKTEKTKTVTRERVPDNSNKEEIGNVNVTKKNDKTKTVTRQRVPDNSNKEEIGKVNVTKKTEKTKTETRERIPDNSNKEEIGSAIVTKKTEKTKTVTRESVPDNSNKEEIGNVDVTKKTEKTKTVTRERVPGNSNKEEIGNVDVTKKTEKTKTVTRERVPDNSNKEEIGNVNVTKKNDETKTVTTQRVPDNSNKEEIGSAIVTKKTEKTKTIKREIVPDNSNKGEIGKVEKQQKMNGDKEKIVRENELAKVKTEQNEEEVQREKVLGFNNEKQEIVNDKSIRIKPEIVEQQRENEEIEDKVQVVEDVKNNNDKSIEVKECQKEKVETENEQQCTEKEGQENIAETRKKSDDSYETTTKNEVKLENAKQDIEKSEERKGKPVKVENEQDNIKAKEEIETNDSQQLIRSEGQLSTAKSETKNKAKEENSSEKNQNNTSYKIPITSPVQYHELTNLPAEERPPKSVCLNVRGAPRRIPLVSKMSKIGFQQHNGVWVLLERLSGVWRILHNSSGLPLAYKLIDNRWVSMRTDKNGCWIPTFNPATTPRTFFDTEGPDDAKPPRRIVLEENGRLGWKEIGEFCGFGFLKNGDMWVLMRKIGSNNWATYKNEAQESFGFKVQDSKWTKFRRSGDRWEVMVDDLPVLHYDFTAKSEASPPELTSYLQKRTGKEPTNVGFRKVKGAWVFMERNANNFWTEVSNKFGFVRATGELWNVMEKGENDEWVTAKSSLEFETAFDHAFPLGVKRESESVSVAPNKKIKIEPVSSAMDVKQESTDRDESSEIAETSRNDGTKSRPNETSSPQVVEEKTKTNDSVISSTSKTNGSTAESTPPQKDNSCSAPEDNRSIPNLTVENRKIDTSLIKQNLKKKMNGKRTTRTNCKPDDGNKDPIIQDKKESTSAIPKDEEQDHTVEQSSNPSSPLNRGDLEATQNKEESKTALPGVQSSNDSPTKTQGDLETTQIKEESNSAIPKDAHPNQNQGIVQPSSSLSLGVEDLGTTQKMEEFNTAIPNEDEGAAQNGEELNCVEKYLALKPDCCLGCPELQSLLRQFRPADVPRKILRKRFRLPDGRFRRLSIPRAAPVPQTPTEIQEVPEK